MVTIESIDCTSIVMLCSFSDSRSKNTDVRNRTEIHILSAEKDLRKEIEFNSTKSYMPVTV